MLFVLFLIAAVVSVLVWRSARTKVYQQNPTYKGLSGLAALATIVFGVLALMQCFTVIPAGHVGVVDFFGTVSDNTLRAGINPVNPLARVVKFSVQTNEHKEVMQVLSREGLTIGLEISALYRLDADSAASVYKKITGETTLR